VFGRWEASLQPDQTTQPLADEDQTRAHVYALLGRLLTSAPDDALLAKIAAFAGDESEIGQALTALAATARNMDAPRIAAEYQDVFTGVTRGEVVPYASYYLTGFLHSKPLANLRGDMARLGIVRAEGVVEPEDHIGSLCEMMAGLISGAFDRAVDLAEQRRFFDAHIAAWAPRFFADLEAAKSAVFYMPVAKLGRSFLAIETQAFALIAADQAA
jgi:TorA maturation chaperone TorD